MNGKNFSGEIIYSDEKLSSLIAQDYKNGTNTLKGIGAVVGIFGSARFDEKNFYCQKAEELAKMLANEGIHIASGGSGGIMAAANKGAYASGKAESLGFNLLLPFEQKTNEFTTRDITLNIFSARKAMLVKNAVAIVAFPGGFGTLDELFDTLVLTLTRKMLPIRFYLYGSEFWRGLIEFINTTLIDNETISKEDAAALKVSDDLTDIVSGIKEYFETYLQIMKEQGLDKSEKYLLMRKQFEQFTK
jgi:uncharacterized protein (TIGR00730 family)